MKVVSASQSIKWARHETTVANIYHCVRLLVHSLSSQIYRSLNIVVGRLLGARYIANWLEWSSLRNRARVERNKQIESRLQLICSKWFPYKNRVCEINWDNEADET